MATTKKRINISVSRDMDAVLARLAKRDQMPQATKAEHLIALALEMEEDDALDAAARRRDRKAAKLLPHAAAWR
jgi:hypothetical protein